MSDIVEISVAVLIIISRVMSHFEHKSTKKDVTEIKFFINGEMENKIEEAKAIGRQELLDEQSKIE